MSRLTICLDFDGVINSYAAGWQGHHVISDAPVPGVGRYILRAMASGFDVAIYSSRSSHWRGRKAMKRYVHTIMEEAVSHHSTEALGAWISIKNIDVPGPIVAEMRIPSETEPDIIAAIQWPWFKPTAFITIDDRALTFNGKWDDPRYDPDVLKEFKPWNKKTRRRRASNAQAD